MREEGLIYLTFISIEKLLHFDTLMSTYFYRNPFHFEIFIKIINQGLTFNLKLDT